MTGPAGRVAALPALVTALVLLAALAGVLAALIPWSGPGHPPVTADWTRDFTVAEHAAAASFHARLRPPAYLGLAAGLVAAALLGLTPAGGRLVATVARPLGGGVAAQVVLGAVALLAVARLVTLPFSVWREGVLRDAGLSTRTWAGFAADLLRGFGVDVVVTVLAVGALVALARVLPRTWWIPAAAGAAALVLVGSFAYPLLVEPLFNRFEPMPPGPLRTSLLDLAARDGVPVQDVLVADASRRTSTLNAYVSGFGSTRRLVVYDTLLDALPDEQVRAVVAHELGHVARRDVLVGTAAGALGAAAGVCLLAAAVAGTGLTRRAGVESLADPRSIALVLALVTLVGAVLLPAQNLASRRVEARADQDALALTGDPDAVVALQRSLALRSLADLDPSALTFALFATHPTAPARIAAARSWALAHDVPEPADLAPSGGGSGG